MEHLEPNERPHGDDSGGAQPTAEPPEAYGDRAQAWADMRTDRQWRLFCMLAGAGIGSLCGALIFLFGASETYGMTAMLAALVIALVAPKLLERRLNRSMRRLQLYLIAAFGVWLVVFFIVLLASGTPFIADPS